MNDDRFWSLLEPGKLDEDPKNLLRAELQKLEAAELIAFQQRFDAAVERALRWDLWGAAHWMFGSCSDEEFLHFRYGLVLRGRTVFEAALRSADSLVYANVPITKDRDAAYLAPDTYEAKTGGEMPRPDPTGPRQPAGTQWDITDEKEARRRLPKIIAKTR